MDIGYRSLKKILPLLTMEESWGIMLRAPHGVGKSHMAHWYAKEIGLKCIELRASQLTEGDVLGLPKIQKNSPATDWMPPRWLRKGCSPCGPPPGAVPDLSYQRAKSQNKWSNPNV